MFFAAKHHHHHHHHHPHHHHQHHLGGLNSNPCIHHNVTSHPNLNHFHSCRNFPPHPATIPCRLQSVTSVTIPRLSEELRRRGEQTLTEQVVYVGMHMKFAYSRVIKLKPHVDTFKVEPLFGPGFVSFIAWLLEYMICVLLLERWIKIRVSLAWKSNI
ncbi:hypothetical protein MKX01_037825 [Papaver californicum]|nr:hypothetical protein MKX01_037825 [Papaver californicum]